MFHVFDRWGNPKPAPMTVLAARRTQNVDGTDNLDLLSDLDLEKGDRVAWRDHMGLWREWVVNSTDTSRSDRLPLSTAHCVDAIQELASTYIEDKRNRTATALTCARKALAGTRWILGTVHDGTKTTEADLAFYHTNALSAIQDICATFGLEAVTAYQPDATGTRIATRTLSLVSRRGAATPTKRFTYGKDLASIRRTIDATQVATRLYGWGKGVATTDDDGEETGGYSRKISFADINDGKAYVEDATALAIWGIPGPNGTRIHSEADAEFPDCEDPKQLLTLTKEALKTRSQPVVSYECDVTSLAAAGVNAEGTDIGDTVHIIDTSFPTPLRLEGRILQIEQDLTGDQTATTITLGNITTGITHQDDAWRRQLDQLISNSGAWNDAATGTKPYITDLINRINQIMNTIGGYTYLKPGQGIYVYDKPIDQHPTQVIQIGGGYWRCASSRNANGDWNWRSLANGKGLFADAIYTGLLSDAAGYNSWNLDTGDFKLSARTTVGGKTVDAIAGDSSSAALAEAKKYADQMKRESDQTDIDNLAAAKDYAQAKAEEARKNALASASTDATNKANAALEAAKKAAQAYVDALDESLGQKSVFDRLTNYGKIQGLFMENGNLYANASYVKSGVLDANLVKAGILTDKKGLQYWDMTTGEFRLAGTSTIAGNKASDLATTTAAQRLTSEAEAAAKKYADGIGSNTLASAKADATSKANAAQSAAAADATKKANSAEANAKKAASTDATNKANAALEAAKKAAADGDTSTLEAAKSYADNTATSHVNTFEKALTQQYIFNKLTDGGKLQGLYMSNNLLYVNATYLRSGIISGARSYWNLDSGIFSMSDANGVETVHLDGNGSHNTLTGTFQTGMSGSRLWMSPKFKQKPIGGSADITGAGISFIHATDAAQQPYIAAESTNSEVGEISTLTFNGGRRANTDPGAFVRVGSTKTDNAKMRGVFQALVMRDYSLSSNDAKSSGARLVSSASPDTNAMDTYSELAAWDPNGAVGVKADINTGYLYMGGFLGGYTNRHTLDGSRAWKAWMPNGGAISVGAAATVHFTASSPAKYGRYYAVANADGEWGGIIMHVKNTGGQSGWDILMYNADRNPCTVDMYCDTFGWLVK